MGRELNEKMAFEPSFERKKGTSSCILWLRNRQYKGSGAAVCCLRNSRKGEKGRKRRKDKS